MEIVNRNVSDLKGYDQNARTHSDEQLNTLAESIKIYGFLDPIEVSKDLTIISGHARLSAAIALGLTKVPTICHEHLNKTLTRGYTLAANRIALSAGWDQDKVRGEFIKLQHDDFDLKYTGFKKDEIDDYLNPEALHTSAVDPDSCGTGQGRKQITKLGDVWILGNHRLLCGDSTMLNDVDLLMNGNEPHLMVTDPPYGVSYDPEWREKDGFGINQNSKGKVKNDDCVDWADAYALFQGTVAYVWHAALSCAEVAEQLKKCGFELVNQIIWRKQNFAISRGNYHWQHEPCWYAVRKDAKHSWRGSRDQSTVWEISNNANINDNEKTWGHGTQKPIDCMLKPVENNSRPNDFVYDPFGGSGTTLIACEKSGRRCLMMELDPKYCDIIVERWENFTGNSAVLESAGVD